MKLKLLTFQSSSGTNGNYHLNKELNNIEDIIPILILIILCSNIENIKEEVAFIVDYMNSKIEDFEGEKRLVMNFN